MLILRSQMCLLHNTGAALMKEVLSVHCSQFNLDNRPVLFIRNIHYYTIQLFLVEHSFAFTTGLCHPRKCKCLGLYHFSKLISMERENPTGILKDFHKLISLAFWCSKLTFGSSFHNHSHFQSSALR